MKIRITKDFTDWVAGMPKPRDFKAGETVDLGDRYAANLIRTNRAVIAEHKAIQSVPQNKAMSYQKTK